MVSKNIIGKFKIKMQYLVSTKTPTMENLSITRLKKKKKES